MTYEIKLRKNWITVDEFIFRSWGGQRRLNGKAYRGPVYYLGSPKIAKESR